MFILCIHPGFIQSRHDIQVWLEFLSVDAWLNYKQPLTPSLCQLFSEILYFHVIISIYQ